MTFPKLANHTLNLIAGGWQLSTNLRALSGNFANITTGVDNALSGIGNQRATQVLANVFDANPTVDHYLNKLAFGSPVAGTLSTMRPLVVQNPGVLQVDMGLSRTFRIREGKTLQVRGEAFNVLNHLNPVVNPGAPTRVECRERAHRG